MKRTGLLVITSAAAFAFAAGSASAMGGCGGYAHLKKTEDAVAEAPNMTPIPSSNELAMSAPAEAGSNSISLLPQTTTIQ